MIKAKLIFPNFQAKSHEETINGALQVQQIKNDVIRKLMQENNYTKEGHDPKIRLFYLGTELQDNKPISEYWKDDAGDMMILHVFINFLKAKSQSGSSNKKDSRGDSICCSIF